MPLQYPWLDNNLFRHNVRAAAVVARKLRELKMNKILQLCQHIYLTFSPILSLDTIGRLADRPLKTNFGAKSEMKHFFKKH